MEDQMKPASSRNRARRLKKARSRAREAVELLDGRIEDVRRALAAMALGDDMGASPLVGTVEIPSQNEQDAILGDLRSNPSSVSIEKVIGVLNAILLSERTSARGTRKVGRISPRRRMLSSRPAPTRVQPRSSA